MEPSNYVVGDFVSPCGAFKLTFDDEGKVAYAYLKTGNSIVGDVWVYNRCPTPDLPEWKDRRNLPFANCKEFVSDEGHFKTPIVPDDISVEWQYTGEQPKALVYLSGALVAVLGFNDKPGYSRFALKDGPLAKVLIAQPT
jgi:hypothetical protein